MKNANVKYTALSLLVFLCMNVQAQSPTKWTLEACIERAVQQSIQVRQAQVGTSQSEAALKQSRLARLPNLNANTNGQWSFGRTIDFTTNTFSQDNRFNNSWSLNSGLPLYMGGQLHNSVLQSKSNVMAAKADAKNMRYNIALMTANAYLSVLMAEEQLENGRSQKQLSEAQLEQLDKLIQAGTRPRNARLDLMAQIAQNDQLIVQQSNQVEFSKLQLKQLLFLPPEENIELDQPNIETFLVNRQQRDFQSIYQNALRTQPSIEAAGHRLRSAELAEKVAKGAGLPQLSLSASLQSYYSNQAKQISTFTPFIQEVKGFLNNEPATFGFPDMNPVLEDYSYMDQLDDNFGQSVGFNLNIPIYNRGNASVSQERARLQLISAELDELQAKQDLESDILEALREEQAALAVLEASQISVEALDAAYQNMQKSYELGAANTFDLTSAKNNLDRAKIDVIRAKYQYVLWSVVVDFYNGRSITLDQ